MKVHGTFFEIDYVFNVIYIDAYVDLYALFKKNANTLLANNDEQDRSTLEDIQQTCNSLNAQISSLSGIKSFEEKIAPEYRKFRHEAVTVSVKSEIAVKGLYSNIVPYIKQDADDSLYPTSGEGRKKLLVYSIFDLLSKEEEDKKINLFLIEEPENHLHRSMQIALSHVLFSENKYRYLFITTHSPYVLAEMDQVNLVRIYNADKIVSRSVLYVVPEEFKEQRKMLNRGLTEAIFADKVLLVEGPSEMVLFGKVLSEKNPFYEADGIYILSVGGFGFKPYQSILNALKIYNVVKTDNDLRKPRNKETYSVLGFMRLNGLIGETILPEDPVNEKSVAAKRELYDKNRELALEILKNSSACQLYLKSKYFKIYVDEYQDCDKDMHALFMYLCETLKIDTFVVGDEKQSIYMWRGAYPEAFMSIWTRGDFSKKVMTDNYRSCQQIQNYSNLLCDETRPLYKEVNDLGYSTKDEHCKKVYETICDKKFHPAFNIDGLQRIAITFHSSKGLEFDQVILFVSDYTLETEQDICNHYVAATRAKSKLILVHISDDGRAAIYVKNIKKILAESNLTMRKIATVVDGINGSKQ